VLLGALVLGEMLGTAQAIGGALVLSAVLVLQAPLPELRLRRRVAAEPITQAG
jgi:drug/metabolite transporter (DMT)-like permease